MTIGVSLVAAAFLNSTLRELSAWLGYIDWLLLVTLYVGLLRNPIPALITATVAGLLQDGLSGSRFGISGMAHLLAVWFAFQVSSRFFVEGLLIRIPIAAGAALIYYLTRLLFYRLLGFTLPLVVDVNRGFVDVFFHIFINLTASVVVFAFLDRFFKAGFRQRIRRAEALRGFRRNRWNIR
ncbi:MAG: rod shape-determining protein MreD [Blastocatellia bacterium]